MSETDAGQAMRPDDTDAVRIGGWTPGPWEAVGSVVRTAYRGPRDGGGFLLADCLAVGTEGPRRHANARLMAAAPELLEALEGLTALDMMNAEITLDMGPGGTPEENAAIQLIDERMAAARAAIAKATAAPLPKSIPASAEGVEGP